jgi:hypothetical protein
MRGDVAPLPDADVVSQRLLSIFVQLMKVHRNIAFGAPKDGQESVAPASVFFTVLAGAAYALKAPQPHETPLDLLSGCVRDDAALFPAGGTRVRAAALADAQRHGHLAMTSPPP